MAFQKTTKYHQRRIINICEGIKGTVDNISRLEDSKAIQAHISQALSYAKSLKAKLEEFERFEEETNDEYLARLIKQATPAWSDVEDHERWLAKVRGYDEEE